MLGLKLIVSGTTKSTLIAVKLGQLTTNGQGQYNCYVEVPDEWQGKSVHAVFNTTSQLVVDNYVDIPDNELQKELIQISIIGKDDLETYTTNIVNVKVVQGYNCNDILVMTPSEWEQYIALIDSKVDLANDSADSAKLSEINAKESETNAKDSADKAKISEINSKTSEDNAKISEDNAKVSETNAKISEDNAEKYAELSEQNADGNGYVYFEIIDGRLNMTKTEKVDDLNFELKEGRLLVTYE